jgi:hypothetical protein
MKNAKSDIDFAKAQGEFATMGADRGAAQVPPEVSCRGPAANSVPRP